MELLTTAILRRSSDAVVIVGLADGSILDINEAFFTVTGQARHELVGRPGRDLFIGLGHGAAAATAFWEDLGSIADAPVGFWTRLGELRAGDLSALVLETDGQHVAVCTIRGVREPTTAERRLAARAELDRILGSDDGGPRVAAVALQALGACLRWEFGALWRRVPQSQTLRCAAVWRCPQADLEPLEALTRHAGFPPGLGAVRRTWLRGEPTWVPDVLADSTFSRGRGEAGEPMHGWFGFPVWGPDGVIGAAELLSREVRQPDPELLAMVGDLGRRFGRLLEAVAVPDVGRTGQAGPRWSGAEPPPRLPTGLTLKAVSRRTGIPAATLRTWEHRYGFMRPRRSPSGYRLYGEEEIARIEQVKYLVGQGVRVGAAMKAVIEEARYDQRGDDGRHAADPSIPGKTAEVYRLAPRSTHDRRS
jgi:PAS domain S-box-containing protein